MSVEFFAPGEVYTGTDPAVVKVKRVTMGVSSASVDIEMAAAAAYTLFTIPAGTLILGVATRVVEAASGSGTWIIGDSDAVWCASATVAPGSTGVLLKMDGVGGAVFEATGFKVGKVFDAAQDVSVTLDSAITTGKIELYVKYASAGLI